MQTTTTTQHKWLLFVEYLTFEYLSVFRLAMSDLFVSLDETFE